MVVRNFRKLDSGELRRGMWVMTREGRGAFFHGDRNEIQAPHWDVTDLIEMVAAGQCAEITPQEVVSELGNWPEGAEYAKQIFDRHEVEYQFSVAANGGFLAIGSGSATLSDVLVDGESIIEKINNLSNERSG